MMTPPFPGPVPPSALQVPRPPPLRVSPHHHNRHFTAPSSHPNNGYSPPAMMHFAPGHPPGGPAMPHHPSPHHYQPQSHHRAPSGHGGGPFPGFVNQSPPANPNPHVVSHVSPLGRKTKESALESVGSGINKPQGPAQNGGAARFASQDVRLEPGFDAHETGTVIRRPPRGAPRNLPLAWTSPGHQNGGGNGGSASGSGSGFSLHGNGGSPSSSGTIIPENIGDLFQPPGHGAGNKKKNKGKGKASQPASTRASTRAPSPATAASQTESTRATSPASAAVVAVPDSSTAAQKPADAAAGSAPATQATTDDGAAVPTDGAPVEVKAKFGKKKPRGLRALAADAIASGSAAPEVSANLLAPSVEDTSKNNPKACSLRIHKNRNKDFKLESLFIAPATVSDANVNAIRESEGLAPRVQDTTAVNHNHNNNSTGGNPERLVPEVQETVTAEPSLSLNQAGKRPKGCGPGGPKRSNSRCIHGTFVNLPDTFNPWPHATLDTTPPPTVIVEPATEPSPSGSPKPHIMSDLSAHRSQNPSGSSAGLSQ